MRVSTKVPCQRKLSPLQVRYIAAIKSNGHVLATPEIAQLVEVTTRRAALFLSNMRSAGMVVGTKRVQDTHMHWRSKIV